MQIIAISLRRLLSVQAYLVTTSSDWYQDVKKKQPQNNSMQFPFSHQFIYFLIVTDDSCDWAIIRS